MQTQNKYKREAAAHLGRKYVNNSTEWAYKLMCIVKLFGCLQSVFTQAASDV